MTEFSITTDIDAPPGRVWPIMRDVERWHEWTASIRSVKVFGGGPLAVGKRALVRQPKLPPAVWKATEIDEGRSFTWVSRAPGISVVAVHSVEPITGGARARLAISYSGLIGPLFARLTEGIAKRYLDLEAAGLKRRSEDMIM